MAYARLKRTAPGAFAEMEEALGQMAMETSGICVQAPSDQVLMWQGRARQLLELTDLIKDCIVTAEKLEAKLKGR